MTKNIVIAIDGPAGAGKSTIAKQVAKLLEIEYIDTGAMYRALTLKVLDNNLDPKSSQDVIDLMKNTSIDFRNQEIYLDDKNVSKEIRENRINTSVSFVAAIKEVREEMVKLQQNISQRKSVIMDGRDIGTVVLPDADFKIFLTASVEERARRRYIELVEKGAKNISFKEIKDQIEDRDKIDSSREHSPLRKADDAYLLDNTNLDIEGCVKEIISIVEGRK